MMNSPAAACTCVPEDHNGGGGGSSFATGPALAEVGTLSLLADGVKLKVSQFLLDLDIPLAAGNRLLHPFRLGEGLLLGPDLHGIGIAVDEIGEGRRLIRQPRSKSLEAPGGLRYGDGVNRSGRGEESRRRTKESGEKGGAGLHLERKVPISEDLLPVTTTTTSLR